MKKTIAFSDLHGNYQLWKQIQNYYDKNDTLIFLGDACDRGPDGIKIMQEMFADSRVIYLKGNHEDMFLNFVEHKALLNELDYHQLIIYNGCQITLDTFFKLNEQEQQKLIDNLKNKTKMYYIYNNKEKKKVFLSHAGAYFSMLEQTTNWALLWDRSHIEKSKYHSFYKDTYIVHGHTPVQTVLKTNFLSPQVYFYCQNHKIDIDLGTYVSQTIATLDLDTFEIKYFKEKENN